jgi:hypothetical protein
LGQKEGQRPRKPLHQEHTHQHQNPGSPHLTKYNIWSFLCYLEQWHHVA